MRTVRFEVRMQERLLELAGKMARRSGQDVSQWVREAIVLRMSGDMALAAVPRGRPWPKKRKDPKAKARGSPRLDQEGT